jgi:hypothetical protein
MQDALILPQKHNVEPMPNVIAERIAKKFPQHSQTFSDVFRYMIDAKATENEMTNIMLVSEKVLEEGTVDLGSGWGTAVELAKAVLGFQIEQLSENEPARIIPTLTQLASDTAVATFIIRYCPAMVDQYGRTQHHHLMTTVRIKRGGRYKPLLTFANPYLETLLRAQPEDHEIIGEYLKERGLDSHSERAVIELQRYVEHANGHPALHDGWL